VVVDNDSADGSADLVAAGFPEAVLVRNDRNDGFARGSNLGIARATGRHVLLLNSDTVIHDDSLQRMARYLDDHPDCGAVGAQLLNTDGTVQRACMAFPNRRTPLYLDTPLERWFPRNRELHRYFMRDWDHTDSRDVDQPPGACLAIPRRVLAEIGPLEPRFFIFFVDVDLCLRLRQAGYRIHFLAAARVTHHLGQSTKKLTEFPLVWQRDRLVYYRKHFGRWTGPYLKLMILFRAGEVIWTLWRQLRCGAAFRAEARKVLGIVGRLLRS